MDYLNNLAEIPSTVKTIIEQGGIAFINNCIKEENKVVIFCFFLL